MKTNKKLIANFLEVIFNEKKINIFRTEYSSKKFKNFKKNKNYWVHRKGDYLYAWKQKETEEELPSEFKSIQIEKEKDSLIFCKIIETAIVNFLRSNNYRVYKKRYSSIWELILSEKKKKFGDLLFIPVLKFSIRNLYSVNYQKQVISLSIRQEYRPKFKNKLNNNNMFTSKLETNSKGEILTKNQNILKYLKQIGKYQEYRKFNKKKNSDQYEYKKLKEHIKNFNQIKKGLFLPENLRIDKFSIINIPNSKFDFSIISKPTYFFHNNRTGRGKYDELISKLRPYSYDYFQNKKINILGLTPNAYKKEFRNYLNKVINKLEKDFYLNISKKNIFVFDYNNPQDYIEKIKGIDLHKYDLALVVFSKEDKDLAIKNAPYYLTKAKLLNQKVPSQNILIENIRQGNAYIFNNITLNIYSKLGGTAWAVEKKDKSKTEFVVGISSTTDINKNRIIGFANIFDYDGSYLLGDCSQLSTKQNYVSNLETYLKKLISNAISKKNIDKKDTIRIIFHIYKEAGRNKEIKAIENTLSYFKEYQISYCFVHLSYNHNMRIFNKQKKASPTSGTYTQISTYQALLCLKNLKQPILVRINKKSTYINLDYIVQQVLYFTHLSYSSLFSTSSKPVTMKYPSKMAKMASRLREIDNWDPEIMNLMADKLWFI